MDILIRILITIMVGNLAICMINPRYSMSIGIPIGIVSLLLTVITLLIMGGDHLAGHIR